MTETPPGIEPTARLVDRLLQEYDEYHRHKINRLIHVVCVPIIFWCVLALLYALPFPEALRVLPGVNWAVLVVVIGTLAYLFLSVPLGLAVLAVSAASLLLAVVLSHYNELPLWQLAVALLLLAWGLRFLGHRLEGRKSTYLKELQLTLVAPAWLLANILRLAGIKY